MGVGDEFLDCKTHSYGYHPKDGCPGCLKAALRYVVDNELVQGEIRESFEAILRGEKGAADWIGALAKRDK